ncbi:MAG: hypothetical protein ACRC0C_20765 [Gibbsiella quercinecans]|uniref:hypothetical protein n=1 Tax=Gibbsiella quercinecans TaxID=929813 RepID=UPI003F36907F
MFLYIPFILQVAGVLAWLLAPSGQRLALFKNAFAFFLQRELFWGDERALTTAAAKLAGKQETITRQAAA